MFRGLLRPGQGFKRFEVIRKTGGVTKKGRPTAKGQELCGEIIGIISQANPKEIEQSKQAGHPITHTIVQRGAINRAKAGDILVLPNESRRFIVHGKPKDPGELGHFTIYTVEEREDLQ